MTTDEVGELQAQRVACAYLVRGCETARFDFHTLATEPADLEAARTADRAAEILQDVLASWRETLALLRDVTRRQRRRPNKTSTLTRP